MDIFLPANSDGGGSEVRKGGRGWKRSGSIARKGKNLGAQEGVFVEEGNGGFGQNMLDNETGRQVCIPPVS